MHKTTSTAALIVIVAAIAFGQAATTTVTGYLTDPPAADGKRGATALHIDCPKRKVAAGTAKYALYDEASKRLYVLVCPGTADWDLCYWGRDVFSLICHGLEIIIPGPTNACTVRDRLGLPRIP
jgi:hypothetical protein